MIVMKDVFTEGLGNLLNGLSDILPKDDPDLRILTGKAKLSDLERQSEEIYIEIGKEAIERDGDAYGNKTDSLKEILSKMADIQKDIDDARDQRQQRCGDVAKALFNKCPKCGKINPDNAKFCADCGTRLKDEPAKPVCPRCGREYPEGTKFCSECGTRLA